MVAARDAKQRRDEQVNSTIVRASEALRIQQGGSVRGWISVRTGIWSIKPASSEISGAQPRRARRHSRCGGSSVVLMVT